MEKNDHIGEITLNHPDEMNTFTMSFARALNDALLDMEAGDRLRVVVIKGVGKHFSIGISLINVGLICLGIAVPLAHSVGRKKTL